MLHWKKMIVIFTYFTWTRMIFKFFHINIASTCIIHCFRLTHFVYNIELIYRTSKKRKKKIHTHTHTFNFLSFSLTVLFSLACFVLVHERLNNQSCSFLLICFVHISVLLNENKVWQEEMVKLNRLLSLCIYTRKRCDYENERCDSHDWDQRRRRVYTHVVNHVYPHVARVCTSFTCKKKERNIQ